MMMEIVALLFRLTLAIMFTVAGVAKFADIERARKGIRDFGLSPRVANLLGIALPLAELTVAILLIPSPTVSWGGIGAIALLATFIVGISLNLSFGRKPECNCFGQVHSKPIGWPILTRNVVLLCGACLVFWEQRYGAHETILRTLVTHSGAKILTLLSATLMVVVLALGGWLAFHLLRQNGRLLLRMDALERQVNLGVPALPASAPTGPPLGTPAPFFELPLLSGRVTSLHTLMAARKTIILLFSDPECGPCSTLLPDVARWEQEHEKSLSIALVSRGSQEANRAKMGSSLISAVLLQKDREVAEAYQVTGTPSAIMIGADGKIASHLALGAQAISNLVAVAAASHAATSLTAQQQGGAAFHAPARPFGLNIGDPAPHIKLPDLRGKSVDLSALLQRKTLVLFWNPSCGYCARMLPELKHWEENREENAPQLLVVSAGTVDANRAMGLRSRVILDQNFSAGLAFQVRGTPSAVLIDTKGHIASSVASGAPAVLALANAESSRHVADAAIVYSEATSG